jgi:hypothetical protein
VVTLNPYPTMGSDTQGRMARFEPRQLNHREGFVVSSAERCKSLSTGASSNSITPTVATGPQSVKRGEKAISWKPHLVAAEHESMDSASEAVSELS